MPQTVLALLALVVVTLLTQQTLLGTAADAADSHESESLVQARGVAVTVLERLAAYPYDGGEGGSGPGTAAYSPPSRFGSGVSASGVSLDAVFAHTAYDDLDDFSGVAGAIASQPVTDPETGATTTLDFEVAISVRYAERDGSGDWQPASSRTHHKLAEVRVTHPTLDAPLDFGRVYAAP